MPLAWLINLRLSVWINLTQSIPTYIKYIRAPLAQPFPRMYFTGNLEGRGKGYLGCVLVRGT